MLVDESEFYKLKKFLSPLRKDQVKLDLDPNISLMK